MNGFFSQKTIDWFRSSLGEPTQVQLAGWGAIAKGGNVLISAPTGTGKTLTAFLTAIDALDRQSRSGTLREETYVLYISPLKSLGNDIRENLKRPIDGIGTPITTAVRNGDTTPSERQKMFRHPPHILITTPESLYILLTTEKGRKMLSTVRTVIIDELHALIRDRRGTHMMLSLARLDALCGRNCQRIGLSATIRPLSLAAEYLGQDTEVVAPGMGKQSAVRVLSAARDPNILPQGTIWKEISREVYEASLRVRTVLVFCEGRAVTEKVAYGVNELGGEGYARSHHGSVSKEKRLEAEQALRDGTLKVLCATSSMELGIDVGDVDLVLQIGCPREVSQAVQRLGRAGHRPGEISRMDLYPRMRSEMLQAALTVQSLREQRIEAIEPQELCRDILAQHLVSMAVAGTYTVDEALALCRSCWCYRDLKKQQLEDVLRMLAGDYEHALDRPVSPRVEYDRINGIVSGSGYSRMLALSSSGTIPDRGEYAVYLEDGTTRLGELEEEFVYEARVGDKFLLGAFAWTIRRIERDRVIVRASSPEGAQSPFWRGDGIGRGYETGKRFGELLRETEQAGERKTDLLTEWTQDETAARAIAEYVDEQLEHNGCLATDRVMVAEYFSDDTDNHQLMLHCPYGGRVNAGLAILLRAQAERETGCDVRVWHDDDGILLMVTGGLVPEHLLERLDSSNVRLALWREVPGTALFAIQFRYNMNRALLMGVRSGGRTPLWIQRMRGAEALANSQAYPEHPMLIDTLEDCIGRHMDVDALQQVLNDIRRGKIGVVTRHVKEGNPSPMTLSLRRQAEGELMYDYAPSHEITVTVPQETEDGIVPETEQLERARMGVKTPDSPQKLHDKLMTEGDLIPEETESPYEWAEQLEAAGRAIYIEPGLWIAAEEKELYERALIGLDTEAQKKILRRSLRYRGSMTTEEIGGRYCLDDVSVAIDQLLSEGIILEDRGMYHHAEVYRHAQRLTIGARRERIHTAEPEAYAALLVNLHKASGSPKEMLSHALYALRGLYLPTDLWENVILPARCVNYRPAMLDELLAAGGSTWRLSGDGSRLAFFPTEDVDWNTEAPENEPTEEAGIVRALLKRRGASFASAIAAAVNEDDISGLLNRMARAGDIVSDSFMPMRKPVVSRSARQRVRARLTGMAGRWETARPIRTYTLHEKLNEAFDRYGIIMRETLVREDISFIEALSLLRQMEYTGKVRRGYFVRGLSGAQFVRAQDFERITMALANPDDAPVCINAADVCEAWGKILKHDPEKAFLCVPGTAVVMTRGEVRLILERQGTVVRSFGASEAEIHALADAFRRGRVFSELRLLTVKQYPKDIAAMLEKAGFVREVLDYVLDRTVYG